MRPTTNIIVLLAAMLYVAGTTAGCRAKGELFIPERRDPATGQVQLPKGAEYVAGGRGELSWKLPEDGRVYVHDVTAERTLFSTMARGGQRFAIVPAEDRASLDGEDVQGVAIAMQTRNEHRIYFQRKQ